MVISNLNDNDFMPTNYPNVEINSSNNSYKINVNIWNEINLQKSFNSFQF